MDTLPRVVGKNTVKAGKFVAYKTIDWLDARGVARTWESVERVNDSGAVLIVATLEPSNRVLLVKQFRPPVGAMVVEFPAGLINPGEDPGLAALRELKEETGYTAIVTAIHAPAFTTPGLTNESVYTVVATIDETSASNRNPQTSFDPSEMIETIAVFHHDLPAFHKDQSTKGVFFDGKLTGFILGMRFTSSPPSQTSLPPVCRLYPKT